MDRLSGRCAEPSVGIRVDYVTHRRGREGAPSWANTSEAHGVGRSRIRPPSPRFPYELGPEGARGRDLRGVAAHALDRQAAVHLWEYGASAPR